MKVQIVSDLHLEEHPLAPFEPQADVLVVAGDTHDEPASFGRWFGSLPSNIPVVAVLGNHEFDRKRFGEVLPAFREAVKPFANVHLLEEERIDIGGVAFLGANLWTDMRGGRDAPAVARVLKHFDMHGVTVDDLMALHKHGVAWLERDYPRDVQHVVVVTHTAPSFGSQHPRFAGSPLNGFFASDLDALVHRLQPQLWIHGHMHDPVDYNIGASRVISNPRGYAGENPGWDPYKAIFELRS
ncbi:MAG: metallophosphoesterase [Candidatus Eremiobacteraeota bacterium]|nr:metallophosphoesterase [Candidatus Eremiobacteraeota bacterium]MBV8366493.1 metallophosphoesterase [Candidatus Eremiobacteraeota bacterium]